MRNVLILVIILSAYCNSFAQSVNLNPDPNGDPWISGGYLLNDTVYEDEYYLKLLNLNGENIKNINIGYLSDGNHNIILELPDLQPGMYYYSLNNSRGYVAGNKMIITN